MHSIGVFMKKKLIESGSIIFVTIMLLAAWNYWQFSIINAAGADSILYENMDISLYRTSEEYTAPQKEGYIFGGWYEDNNEEKPLSDTKRTGKAYAKFVPEDVLKVLCQNSANVNEQSDMSNVRLVTSTDSNKYQHIGFEIEVYGTTISKFKYETSKVYKSIKITTGKDTISVSANRDFSKESNYFVTVKMINIPNSGFGIAYEVRPYWLTLDGTKVYGIEKYARVRNGYDGSFSVPVRVNTVSKSIAAALLSIDYDNTNLEFEGYDEGTLFDEYAIRENQGEIKLLSDTKQMDKNVIADGRLFSLNFRVKNYDKDEIDKTYSFQLNKAEFCDINEKEINIENIVLRSVMK